MTFRISSCNALVAAALLTAFACSSTDSASPAPDASVPDAAPSMDAAPDESVVFTPCDLHSEGGGAAAECATTQTPLDPNKPNGEQISMFVKRYRAPGGKGLRQLWMLQGGPGASGYAFEGMAEAIATKYPDVDFYMPDHRGTGRSNKLDCGAAETTESEGGIAITPAEWPTCLELVRTKYKEQLAHFTTTNAANDIGVLIRRLQQPGVPAFVYGVSYGTYWAHRYLQMFPEQPAGVVFDSILPQGGSLAQQDADANEAGRDYFAMCGRDTFCKQKLGADPWAKVTALFDKLKTGHCSEVALPDFPTHMLLRRAFGGLMMDVNLRSYIAPIVYRFDRCNSTDIPALRVLLAKLTEEQPESEMMKQWGWTLFNNVAYSELWETPAPTVQSLAAIREASVVSRDVTEVLEPTLGKWPTYTPDSYASSYATSSKPLLFLQGGLDPATLRRKARDVRPHFQGKNQHWVEIETAGHTVIVSSATPAKRSCGTMIMMSFLENPNGELDQSCVATVLPIDFANTRTAYNQALFGRSDAWE